MSRGQKITAFLGALAMLSVAWGWRSHVIAERDLRLAEIRQQENRDIIRGMQAGQEAQADSLVDVRKCLTSRDCD